MSKHTIQDVTFYFNRDIEAMKGHPDKAIITRLTILAGDNTRYAREIVELLNIKLTRGNPDYLLTVLYLIDSILKNQGREFTAQFATSLDHSFCQAFGKINSEMKKKFARVVSTWDDSRLFREEDTINIHAAIRAWTNRPTELRPPVVEHRPPPTYAPFYPPSHTHSLPTPSLPPSRPPPTSFPNPLPVVVEPYNAPTTSSTILPRKSPESSADPLAKERKVLQQLLTQLNQHPMSMSWEECMNLDPLMASNIKEFVRSQQHFSQPPPLPVPSLHPSHLHQLPLSNPLLPPPSISTGGSYSSLPPSLPPTSNIRVDEYKPDGEKYTIAKSTSRSKEKVVVEEAKPLIDVKSLKSIMKLFNQSSTASTALSSLLFNTSSHALNTKNNAALKELYTSKKKSGDATLKTSNSSRSRSWFILKKDWEEGNSNLNDNTGSTFGHIPSLTRQDSVSAVKSRSIVATEKEVFCAICGDAFERFYNTEPGVHENEWMMRNAVEEIDERQKKSIYKHQTCVRLNEGENKKKRSAADFFSDDSEIDSKKMKI